MRIHPVEIPMLPRRLGGRSLLPPVNDPENVLSLQLGLWNVPLRLPQDSLLPWLRRVLHMLPSVRHQPELRLSPMRGLECSRTLIQLL